MKTLNEEFGETGSVNTEINSTASPVKLVQHFLTLIKPVDFIEEAGVDHPKDLFQKDKVVITTYKLIESIEGAGYGITIHNGTTFIFNKRYWKAIDDGLVLHLLGEAAHKMGLPVMEAKHHKFRKELLSQLTLDAFIPELDQGNKFTLINLLNGTLSITNDRQYIRNFRMEDFLNYQLPFEYNPVAEAPIWQEYLNRVLPDKSLQQLLREYIGYCFTRNVDLKLEKILILFGKGHNGKSVLHDVLIALFGSQNVSNFSLQSLTTDNGNSVAMIAGKLLNISSEISTKVNPARLKKLASGEPVEAKKLYKDIHIITEYARFIFNCNLLPAHVEQTNAFYRRFIIIPFEEEITEDEKDVNLARKIVDQELPGVLNWAIEGLQELIMNEKFSASPRASKALEQFKLESNPVQLFLIEEGYKPSNEQKINRNKVYLQFKAFCSVNGYQCDSAQVFYHQLRSLGYNVPDSNSGGVRYIYLEKQLN